MRNAALPWSSALAPEAAQFWLQSLPALMNGMLLGMAAWMLMLAWMQPRERKLAYLAALMGSWVLLNTGLWPAPLALPPQWDELLRISLLPVLALCTVQLLLRQVQIRDVRVDWILRGQCLLVPVSALLAGAALHGHVCRFWAMLLGLEVLAAMVWFLRLSRRAEKVDLEIAPLAKPLHRQLVIVGGLLLLSELVFQHLRSSEQLLISPLLLPPLLMLLALHAGVQMVRSGVAAERLHLELEAELQEKITSIERDFNQVAEQKLEQVTERERKRIAADLHDDLGAKLLTIVHTSESDRISTLAREALEEMRLSVRGLTGKPVQLLDALGDWRAEVVSRLGQANIMAEWKSPAEDIVHTLPARAYVQTTRILRESVSNIIKHSGATHCTVTCNVQDGDFQFIIQDNGQGIANETEGRLDRGHGMASMKSRAKQMHGQCLVESGPGWGTVIRLTIPL
ncbi:ATP-binding protein [Pelomonas sp. SE-A7]|uniref:sensor histidine kinase n=1 Tax=Pelomonas sp. SE-A7 TaxID=3054953 RepID=UPI00259D17CE|nr:ATP-binding protein [Pelomonas sp. SE-A7]MDM4767995.1 ATP-binding protein [Pelomonas sp. SE-A7]